MVKRSNPQLLPLHSFDFRFAKLFAFGFVFFANICLGLSMTLSAALSQVLSQNKGIPVDFSWYLRCYRTAAVSIFGSVHYCCLAPLNLCIRAGLSLLLLPASVPADSCDIVSLNGCICIEEQHTSSSSSLVTLSLTPPPPCVCSGWILWSGN